MFYPEICRFAGPKTDTYRFKEKYCSFEKNAKGQKDRKFNLFPKRLKMLHNDY